jgi:hypothetical protein
MSQTEIDALLAEGRSSQSTTRLATLSPRSTALRPASFATATSRASWKRAAALRAASQSSAACFAARPRWQAGGLGAAACRC